MQLLLMNSLILIITFIFIVNSYKIPLPRYKRNTELSSTRKDKPHIVIISASELGWDDISQHGSPLALTPNLHTLAKHGIHFSHHYITPWDFTTRVELFTGEYASHQGLQHGNVTNDQPIGINPKTKILPEYLKELGYNTTLLGKWGLGFYNNDVTPLKKGFDQFIGSLGFDNIDYYNYTSKSKYQGHDFYENDKPIYPSNDQHLTDLLTDEACNVIHNQKNSTKPLFLHVSFQSPQFSSVTNKPQAPKQWMKPFEGIFNDTDRIGHSAMVLSLDVAIGKIMDSLSVANMFEDTFFLFLTTSTSKSCSSVHGVGCNYPLKGGKGTYWEGGVRSMAMVYYGDISTPGKTIKDTIHITDWLPTILNLATNQKSPSLVSTLHGFDLWNVISKGEKSKREFILHGYDPLANNSGAIRLRDYKLVINQPIDSKSDWTKYFKFDRNKSKQLEIPGFRPITKSKPDVDSVVLCDSGFPHPYLRLRAPPCNPSEKPCLFNILWDPCEYHNLADFLPKTAHYLYENSKMILDSEYVKKPLYPESDDRSDPKNFNSTWAPWIESYMDNNKIKQENLTNLLDEDKIIILNNKTENNNFSDGGSKSNNVTTGETRTSSVDNPEKELFPYQLVNENEIDIFGKDNSPGALEKYGGRKILKISCEELDFYNYTIECVSVTNSADNNNFSINSADSPANLDLVQFGTYMENITDKILADDHFKIDKNGSFAFNLNSSYSPDNDPFKQSFNRLVDNNNQTTNKTELNEDKDLKTINVIPFQNISQITQKNITRPIPVNVERFSMEEKPERSLDKNETIDVTNTYTITTTISPPLLNVTHTIGQEDNKNETIANDEIKKKLENSFKIAKAEGSTKLVGPFDEKNSTLKLLTNALAGNITDKKNESYPDESTTDENNPNIDWHLTSKAVSVDFSPNVTRSNWTDIQNPNWTNLTNNNNYSNFSKMENFTNSKSNFTDFPPATRDNLSQAPPKIESDVKAIADANTGESINVNTLSINKSDRPNSTIQNTVEKPIYNPINNPIHNVTNNTSQKSLIKDGDSFRSLEIINEPLDQNATHWISDCNCDHEGGDVSCDKCIESKSKDKLALANDLEKNKNIQNSNLVNSNTITDQKTDRVPFSGQIEMSNKKFNVEGTVSEDLQSKSITNGDYSVSASNDNMIGMSLLKNGGYDPKQQNHNQELEFRESSAHLKLSPSTSDHLKLSKKHNNTRMIRTKKGIIQLVGELGDSNEEENITNSVDPKKESSMSKIISNLEQLLGKNVPTENNTLDNIKDLFKSRMASVLNQHNLTGNDTVNSTNGETHPNTTQVAVNDNKTNTSTAATEDSSQKKDWGKSQNTLNENDSKKDSISSSESGTKANQAATLIAIILAGLIVIGMGIVAVVAVVAKSIDGNTKSSKSKKSNNIHQQPSSSRSHRLKDKIPFNT